jgi:hypothetical protein
MANGTIAASQLEMLSQSGTGIITITPPATNTNRAITLPDAAGALVVSGTTPSLNGITFPATQVPSADANTLDDYEEGTWTPQAQDQSGNQFPSYTGTPSGIYTKIGRLVHVSILLRTGGSTTGMNTGEQLKITGLPFTAVSSSAAYVHCAAGLVSLSPATYFNLLANIANGTSLDIFSTGGDATSPYTATNFTVANFESGSGAFININFCYTV